MRHLLNQFARRAFGRVPAEPEQAPRLAIGRHSVDELQAALAAKTRELGELRRSKDQEIQAAWDHAQKLDAALQQLDAFVQSGGHTANSRARADDGLAHAFGDAPPAVASVIVPDLAPTEQDVRIAARLLVAYRRAAAEEARRGCAPRGDCWAWIRTLQPDFLGTLDRNDPADLAAYLCNMSRRDATIGTDQGNLEYDRLRSDPAYRDRFALRYKDKLVSLAEAVGAVPCENPEQGAWGRALHADAGEVAAAIGRVLNIDITPPPIDGGLLKVVAGRGLFSERDCSALFTAWSLRQVFGSLADAALCEIGAGSGRVAYWSRRFGCASYTVFDLPHINVIQGFYLLKALNEDGVSLYGEAAGGATTVLPYFAKDGVPARSFDLVLNQDSFPEIEASVVRDYLAWIKTVSRRYFLSLNHESKPLTIGGGEPQVSVPELVAEAGGYRRVSRAPYWLRRGYVAELYRVDLAAR